MNDRIDIVSECIVCSHSEVCVYRKRYENSLRKCKIAIEKSLDDDDPIFDITSKYGRPQISIGFCKAR